MKSKDWKWAAYAVFVVVAAWLLWPGRLHVPIDAEDVRTVELWGTATGIKRQEATPEQAQTIIAWFNRSTDQRDNSARAGTTPESGIRIEFKSGGSLGIFRSGSDFEVQDFRSRKPRYYWLRNPEMRAFLDKLTKLQ